MNITDFAKQIGVSRATVWRAMSGQGPINEVTRKLVLEKAEELGLRPNRAAHAFATGRSYLVELWIEKVTDFASLILRNLEHQLNNDGFDPIVRTWDSLNTGRGLGKQYAWPVDGVIAVDPQDDALISLRERYNFGTPVVNIGSYWVENTDFVGLDMHAPSIDAMNSLVANDCKRIAYVSHSFGQQADDARRSAYVSAIKKSGIQPEYIVTDDTSSASASQAVRRYVLEHGHPDGLFCYNDSIAIGAYRALYDCNLRIPEDVVVTGCDGLEVSEFLEPPLSTIVLPVKQMCTMALCFLYERVNNPSIPQQGATLKPQFLSRRSSVRR